MDRRISRFLKSFFTSSFVACLEKIRKKEQSKILCNSGFVYFTIMLAGQAQIISQITMFRAERSVALPLFVYVISYVIGGVLTRMQYVHFPYHICERALICRTYPYDQINIIAYIDASIGLDHHGRYFCKAEGRDFFFTYSIMLHFFINSV